MTKKEVESALDHAVKLGFLKYWKNHTGGQVRYEVVRGFQPAGYVVVHWKDAAEYLAQEGLFNPDTGETLTP